MAYLELNAIEPVAFGGKECTPEINAETKMRLSQIKKYDEVALDAIASAFPKDESFVRQFLGRMATVDVEILHAYLIGGPTMVEKIQSRVDSVMNTPADEEEK